MSYLLEALRRSERERRDVALPASERVRMALDPVAASALRLRVWLPGLLALNLAALSLGWWLYSSPPDGSPAVSFSAPAADPPTALAPRLQPRPAPLAPTEAPPTPPAAPPAAPTASTAPTEAPPAPSGAWRPPLLSELSAAERAAWPPLQIAAQVYSPTNVAARFVIVDGEFLREGDVMPDGVRVVEILEEEVLFELDGRPARVPVVDEPR